MHSIVVYSILVHKLDRRYAQSQFCALDRTGMDYLLLFHFLQHLDAKDLQYNKTLKQHKNVRKQPNYELNKHKLGGSNVQQFALIKYPQTYILLVP